MLREVSTVLDAVLLLVLRLGCTAVGVPVIAMWPTVSGVGDEDGVLVSALECEQKYI